MSSPSRIRHAVCGLRRSARAVGMTSAMLHLGVKPDYLVIVDDSATNLANTLTLIQTSREFPFWNGVWERSFAGGGCLVSLGLVHQIPFYCFSSLGSQSAHALLQTRPVDVVVNTESPVLRGAFLHIPTYGVLNVHAASLPYFRGSRATAINLYLNEPVFASAFFMTPRVSEGAIVGRARIPVHRGDQVENVIERSIGVSAELVAQVLEDLESHSIEFLRQQPWQGLTCGASHLLERSEPLELRSELAQRLAQQGYGHYEEDRA